MLLSKQPSKRHIIFSVDIGTTNIRCFAYDNFANVLGKADEMVPVLNVGGDEHEIDPILLWNAFQRVVKKCLESCHLNAEDVSCLGISSQRGTFLTWDRETSVPFHNFITWKDKRAESNCNSWNSSFSMKMFRLGAFLLYMVTRKKKFQVASVFKLTSSMVLMRLSWVLENISEIREKLLQHNVLFGTLDTWLIWKLTQGKVHATDGSNASVTGFFDPFQMQWADWILKIFNIPADILPEVKNTCDHFGDTSSEIFGAPIPIYAVVGDQQASMFGACCFEKYNINCTMGTGSFLNMNTGCTPSAAYNGVYPLVGWTIFSRTTYVAECGVHDSGTIISWAQNLGLFEEPHESSIIAQSVTG
ncbi:putative glycerol kinase 5, partial [Stegodyphus mimosarum]